MKQTFRYDQTSCRLQLEGLPDVSVGHSGAVIGILTGWSLQWTGRPELEGRKEHLMALMQVVLPYARQLISGVDRPVGGADLPVEIRGNSGNAASDRGNSGGGHRLQLRSSQPDTPPLEVLLDDAELADLVRVLDQVRLDGRVTLSWEMPDPQPLRTRELLERIPLRRRLAAPLGGVVVLAVSAGLGWLVPPPAPLKPVAPAERAAPAAANEAPVASPP
ncbi:DUF4335 domain-containing protein [Synechococcus sp. CS-1328]|uniref:DUF4335 domain-containing protein n=1 Tax=Synechococcus sp. CS-1328 TaxID=2847976 RepID=UPI00223AC3F9|nr:DUF4335 domain-containing protein [Synechococcus sp. CS-1328]MCT0226118.1 DUF4335 domain-containing protein [Synechococcus sp. CS-1328]